MVLASLNQANSCCLSASSASICSSSGTSGPGVGARQCRVADRRAINRGWSPPPRRQGQGRHAPAARAPCAAGALTLARSGAVMQALAACDASLRQAHVLREGPALHGPSDHPSTPARPAQSPDRTGCSSVLWAARRIPRFPHLLRVAPAPEKARGSGADRPDQGLRAAWWVGTGTAVPAPALSPLPVRMLVMCKGFRAT